MNAYWDKTLDLGTPRMEVGKNPRVRLFLFEVGYNRSYYIRDLFFMFNVHEHGHCLCVFCFEAKVR